MDCILKLDSPGRSPGGETRWSRDAIRCSEPHRSMPCPRPAGHPRSESRRRPGQKGCSATTGVSRFAQPAPPRATPARRAEGGRRAAQSRVRFRAGKGWMGFGWLTRRHESAKGWSPLLHSVICLQKVKHEANVNANDCSKIGLGARWRFAEVDTLKRRARELDLIKKGVGTWRQSAGALAWSRGEERAVTAAAKYGKLCLRSPRKVRGQRGARR